MSTIISGHTPQAIHEFAEMLRRYADGLETSEGIEALDWRLVEHHHVREEMSDPNGSELRFLGTSILLTPYPAIAESFIKFARRVSGY